MESTGTSRTRRTSRAPRACVTAAVDPHQVDADDDERDTEQRYQRHRDFAKLVSEAVRHAEAMIRLEMALALELR